MSESQESAHVYRHGRGTDESHLRDQALFRQLLIDHKQLRRETEALPNGIRVQTTSENPELARIIQEHEGTVWRRPRHSVMGSVIQRPVRIP